MQGVCEKQQVAAAWSKCGQWQRSVRASNLESSMQMCVSSHQVCILLSSIPLSHFPIVSSLITSVLSRPAERNQYIYFLKGHLPVFFFFFFEDMQRGAPTRQSLIEGCYRARCRPGLAFLFLDTSQFAAAPKGR